MALHRLVAVAASRVQDRKWVAFIPLKRFGNDVAGYELLLGTCLCNRRGHGFEYIVAKHEMMKRAAAAWPTTKQANAQFPSVSPAQPDLFTRRVNVRF